MTTTEVPQAVSLAAVPRRGARRLAGRPALFLLASLTVSLLAASAAPTPLYASYQARWGFSPITTTVVFGVYALAVLSALLVLGRLSDHLGRRPVLLAAIAVQAVSLVTFATAGDVSALFAARIVQGISTGAALGAIGAGMLDIDRPRGTLANALAPGLGTGLGALASAVAVTYLPAPTHLIYLALIGVLAVQATGIALMRETVSRKPGALSSLLPEVHLPRAVRAHLLTATPVLFSVWALAGLYGALGPSLVASLSGSANGVLGGLSLTVLAVVGAATVFMLRRVAARVVLRVSIAALMIGVAVTLLALSEHSTAVFFVGTALSAVGFGSGFQGAVGTVVPRVAAHERAGVLSLLFVISYIGLGGPAVAAGYLAVHGAGLIGAARDYGVALIVLAVLAALSLARTARG